MMKDNSAAQKGTIGDAAVDGLLAGTAAGVLMAVYLAAASLTWGSDPAKTLSLFVPGGAASPLVGLITHLAVSGVYGLIFGAGWGALTLVWRGLPAWLAGIVYGLVLLVFALAILLPAAESPLLAIPPVHFAIAHALYGLVLGIGLMRRRKQ